MGHQAGGRPAATGVGAEPGLQAGREVAEGHVLAVAGAAVGTGRAGGSMPRATQPSTGSRTTRSPGPGPGRSCRPPSRPCPPPRGRGRRGSSPGPRSTRELRPSTVARSEPQMPDSSGADPDQSARAARGPRRRPAAAGPPPAPRPEPEGRGHPGGGEAGQAAFEDQGLHRRASELRARPAARAARASPPVAEAATPVQGPRGSAGRPPGRLGPVLDVPAPAPGDGGQPGLGVDGHREAHRLEHGQVAGRVGVGHRLAELRARGPRRSRRAGWPGPHRWAAAPPTGR